MKLWYEYSLNYIKNNKAASTSMVVAALISSLLLSLTCGVFYNIWTDEVRMIRLLEGDWEGRLVGDFTPEDVRTIEGFSNVKQAVLIEADSASPSYLDLYFYHPERIYRDLPRIAEQIGIAPADAASVRYHTALLNQNFIFSPEEGSQPPIVLFIYLFTMLLACLSLILIIHNAFGISMNARIHQLGLLQSIGAGPRQLRRVLTGEALILCLLPVLAGTAAGIGLCRLFMLYVKTIVGSVREVELMFEYHPLLLLVSLAVSFLTVWLSARIPAVRLSRLQPLEAIRYGAEPPVKKIKSFRFLSRALGIEGELAAKSLYQRRKAFRTSAFSLTISFFVFSAFLNMETLSDISTKLTFFQQYQDRWDLMLTFQKDSEPPADLLQEIRALPKVKECTAYQVVTAFTDLPFHMQSDELLSLGGMEGLKGVPVHSRGDQYAVEVPVLILDDESFADYYSRLSVPAEERIPLQERVVLVNTIWDNINSNRRYRKMIPFLRIREEQALELYSFAPDDERTGSVLSVSITDVTGTAPRIREEFPDFSLLMILPAGSRYASALSTEAKERKFSVKAESETDCGLIESRIIILLTDRYKYTLENRLTSQKNNLSFRRAYKLVIGSLAGLLVCIGIANVFSNALGHIHQRKKEFARYISIGLTPGGMKKVLFYEALLLGLKPILISLLLNIPLLIFGLNTSLIHPKEYLAQMPLLPVSIFALVILISTGSACYLGARRIYRLQLVEILKDNTML
jgi:putative ABC transport system permease protein